MHRHPPCDRVSGSRIFKSVCQRVNSRISRSAVTYPITQNPNKDKDIIFLLSRCKGKDQLNQIHAHFTIAGLIQNPSMTSKLVTSFALMNFPGTTSIAHSIADGIDNLDTYTWNIIIRGYLEENNPECAFSVYAQLRRRALKAESYTLLFALRACGFSIQGEQIHAQIYKLGFAYELIIRTAMIQMYGSFDKICCVEQLFDETPQRDLVMWNSLISSYAQKGFPSKALAGLHAMVKDKVRPNGVTAVSVLSSCSSLNALRDGKTVHGYVIRNLNDYDTFVYNALIGMYSKCGALPKARCIFQLTRTRNVVTWTSMIKAYIDNNHLHEALNLFTEMESEDMMPDEITILELISMCSKLGSFKLGEKVEFYAEKNGIYKESCTLANALMDMHAKCGNMKKACQIFGGMVQKTLVSWTSVINGLARHGHGIPALVRFCQMQREGFKPDAVVFLSILSACSHAGLVEEGQKCFELMINDYHMEPWMEHYGCMLDMLCRAGMVKEAIEFAEAMPIKPDAVVCRMLLGACQSQGDISQANRVAKLLYEAGPKNVEDYVVLSNLHAATAGWNDVQKLRGEMKRMGIIKQDPATSLVELGSDVKGTTQ